jgi:2'-5' RNA ligase
MLIIWRSGEMADTTDLKSVAGNSVWVRVPPSLPSFMKTQVKELIDSLEPLFSIQLKTADRFQLDSVNIPVARVRESLKQLRELQKEVQSLKKDKNFMEMMDQKFAHAL